MLITFNKWEMVGWGGILWESNIYFIVLVVLVMYMLVEDDPQAV